MKPNWRIIQDSRGHWYVRKRQALGGFTPVLELDAEDGAMIERIRITGRMGCPSTGDRFDLVAPEVEEPDYDYAGRAVFWRRHYDRIRRCVNHIAILKEGDLSLKARKLRWRYRMVQLRRLETPDETRLREQLEQEHEDSQRAVELALALQTEADRKAQLEREQRMKEERSKWQAAKRKPIKAEPPRWIDQERIIGTHDCAAVGRAPPGIGYPAHAVVRRLKPDYVVCAACGYERALTRDEIQRHGLHSWQIQKEPIQA